MISDVKLIGDFYTTRCKYLLLRRVCNVLVYAHYRSTPRSATPDTLTEIVQEQLARGVRVIEFRCHSLQQRYEALGKEILHDDIHDADNQEATHHGANAWAQEGEGERGGWTPDA